MTTSGYWVLDHRRRLLTGWIVLTALCAWPTLRLGQMGQGGTETIPGSESHAVIETIERAFGRGAPHLVPIVLSSETVPISELEFANTIKAFAASLETHPQVRAVIHIWNSALSELIGRDQHSTLLLVQPNASSLREAETLTPVLRQAVAEANLPPGFEAQVTGFAATFFDLNRSSSRDLLRAEMVGVPLTLLVLLLAFRSVVAAGIALTIALVSVAVSGAILYAASSWLAVSSLTQNVVTMIGLGTGTDYALFVLNHHRRELGRGVAVGESIRRAMRRGGPAVVMSGIAVAGGFAALLLVRVSFVHSLALGGVIVVLTVLAAVHTLLPALLQLAGNRVGRTPAGETRGYRAWVRWVQGVMQRPWLFLLLALAGSIALAAPAARSESWSFGPADLPADTEAFAGYQRLVRDFSAGWMGPIAMTLQSGNEENVWSPSTQRAALALGERLQSDSRVAAVLGFPRLLEGLGDLRTVIREVADVPTQYARGLEWTVSADNDTALIIAVPHVAPTHPDAVALIQELRSAERNSSTRLLVGGGPAVTYDFDRELVDSLGRVMVAVIAMTFVLLTVYFRSLAVPIKAIAANLLSVFAAYGFLVLVFQYGIGASWLQLDPPGGLNPFVVLMLFTILFGLSMDYEIFLLSQIRAEYLEHKDNTRAVAHGLASTATVITSAAAVMVCLFGSFGFIGSIATREFGMGLAFAIAFDATIIRLLIVPATMRLLDRWNWWLPGWLRRQPLQRGG